MRIDDLLTALPNTETDTVIFCDIRDINYIVNELEPVLGQANVQTQWHHLTNNAVRHVSLLYKGKRIYLIDNSDLSEFIRLGTDSLKK